jgi:hypothetical protein
MMKINVVNIALGGADLDFTHKHDKAGKACQEQTLQLIRPIYKL